MVGGQAFLTLTSVTRNSLLDLMLQTAPPKPPVQPERVFLKQGAMELDESSAFVYFPEDALLSLRQISPAHDAVDVAVVGRHACVGPSELWGTQMQAVVMISGHAYRLDWTQLKQDTHVYGTWLWHTTVVTHGLIEQMAQIDNRRAAMVSTLVALRSAEDPEPLIAVGRVVVEISRKPVGTNGFGFDPILWLPEFGQTFAQLPEEVKNANSHRGRSSQAMVALMRERWGL